MNAASTISTPSIDIMQRPQSTVECIMYQTGFCPNGPICFFTHTKKHGYRPQVTDMVRFVLHAYRSDVQQLPPAEPSQQYQAVSEASQQSYHDNLGQPGQPGFAFGGEQVQQTHHGMPRAAGGAFGAGNQQSQQTNQRMPKPVGGVFVPGNQQVQQTHHSSQNQATSYRAPLAGRCRYFVMRFKSHDNLRSAAESGWWKAHQNIIDTLNNAFRECDHVILFFSTNKARHFEGCAKMVSIIGDHDRGSSSNNIRPVNNIGENLQIKWFKLCVLPLTKIEGLTNISSLQNSKDGEELDESVGEKIFSSFLRETDGDLMRLARNRTNIGVGQDRNILFF